MSTDQFCRIWNTSDYEYTEKFRDDFIVIPPKKFIEMDRGEAALFLGQYKPIVRTPDGQPDPRFVKSLRKEIMPEGYVPLDPRFVGVTQPKLEILKCECCGFIAPNKKALNEHLKTHFHRSVDEEKAIKGLKDAEGHTDT